MSVEDITETGTREREKNKTKHKITIQDMNVFRRNLGLNIAVII